ncbi:T-cell surface glycoprotein CD3 zeta chain isoform X2 [Passer montanus]|nr:T-cell surface glycoprotein CD3 zeta chain isoform X2 [Passer montanus]XP_039569078.1 T-cell surface glycoprotein CD3 zeta chain isoform X2 [Passer montanus]
MTALFVKAKLSQASEPQLRAGQDDVYNKLSRGHRDDYDVLGGKRGADPELGGRHQQRRKNPQDTVYTSLQKDKMGEAYSEIGMKGEQQRRRGKGNEGLYQVGTTSHGCSLTCGGISHGTVGEARRSERKFPKQAPGVTLTPPSWKPQLPLLWDPHHRAQLPHPSRLPGKGLGITVRLSGDAS